MTEEYVTIHIGKTRLAEATRQAAAECVDDIGRCLAERGVELAAGLRQLFFATIHAKMVLSVLDVLNEGNGEQSGSM
jgi:hypothetical protein